MDNIHTLDTLNNNSISNTLTSACLADDNLNSGTQLLPVLKLRATSSEINDLENSLERAVAENLKYYQENGSSSISESFPSLYPPAIEDEVTVTSLFDIIKNIYNRLINSGIDIEGNNINTLSNLIRNDPSSGDLSEEIKKVLDTVVNDLNTSINSNNLKPLGQFGDITLNELILKGQHLDFSFLIQNQELIVYPLKLIPVGLVYGTIIRLFMKHCDDNSINSRNYDLETRLHLLRVRRVNIALTLALTAPVATILLLKFGRLSIFDGLKIGGNTDNNIKNELLNYIPIFFNKKKKKITPPLLDKATQPTLPSLSLATRGGGGGKGWRAGFLSIRARFFKIIIFILFIIICVGLYNYNINIFNIYFLFYLWFLILIFSLVYNSIAYFILINKNEIDIDLNKIRIKFIRKNIESFIAIRNSNLDKEKMKKYFISQLYLNLFILILSGFLILI